MLILVRTWNYERKKNIPFSHIPFVVQGYKCCHVKKIKDKRIIGLTKYICVFGRDSDKWVTKESKISLWFANTSTLPNSIYLHCQMTGFIPIRVQNFQNVE